MNAVKKIILNSNAVWTISQFRLGLIRALIKEGYQVVCVADMDNFSMLSEVKLTEVGARFIRLPISRKGVNPWKDLVYFFRLYRLIGREKPDLLINYTVKPIVYGSVAARMRKIPSIAVTTGLGFVFTYNNWLTSLLKILFRISLNHPESVFFLNKDDLQALVKDKLVLPEKSCILPSEGIDTDYYHPYRAFEPPESFYFLLIARLLREKGVYEYIQAARMVKEKYGEHVVFNLIGHIDEDNPGGISREQLGKWLREGVVNYLGTTDDVRPAIAGSSCVVLPSYREGVPRTLMEAASMEKPLIATDVIGCREVVDHGINGFLCKPKDANDLYNKMVDMVRLTGEQRSLMGALGRQKMLDNFDERKVIEVYFDELKRIGI